MARSSSLLVGLLKAPRRRVPSTGLARSTQQILIAVAQAVMPKGQRFPRPDAATIERLEAMLRAYPGRLQKSYQALVHLLEHLAILRRGRRFSRLPAAAQLEYLEQLYQGRPEERLLLRAVLSPLKVAHFDGPDIFARANCVYEVPKVAPGERPRYFERAIDSTSLGRGELVEADVVIVGSGAGGAAVAAELAEMGAAVAVLEEGAYWGRQDFTGRPLEMMRLMYRSMGLSGTVGNCVIPIPLGRCVGGTTTINSGTCYRVPERVLRKWRVEHGLSDFTVDELAPHFAKVEQILRVAAADPRYIGGIGKVIARGCEALGYRRHGPLLRNAPDCDGSSLCCWGCPTDAKRGANVSYVPLALRYGAQLFYNARAQHILVAQGRAAGVEAITAAGVPFTVRARAVVVACGAIGTPHLLLRNALANGSGELGRNLSIHPAAGAFGLFPDVMIDGGRSIPQGYAVEEFHDEGLLFEGAFVPLDVAAGSITVLGRRFTEVMELYEHIGYFAVMLEDSSRGRVRAGPAGQPVAFYSLNRHDVTRLKRGLELLVRIFLAGGARSVFTQMPGAAEIRDQRDLESFCERSYRARDFDLTAHHPLGTARMGLDPAHSVVGPTHESHDLPALFICDGSAVPSSLGVNPMLTIMALATRAARFIARRVEAA